MCESSAFRALYTQEMVGQASHKVCGLPLLYRAKQVSCQHRRQPTGCSLVDPP